MSLHFITSVLSLSIAFSACAKKTPNLEEPARNAVARGPEPKPEPKYQTDREAVQRVADNLRRIHFPFNSDTMTEDSRQALFENAHILIQHPAIIVEVQGHCDLRGTTEYNLALGQRRADAVRRYLERSGVPESHVRTISYGEERPLEKGEGEIAWARNRRAEFRVTAMDGVGSVQGTTQ